MTDNNDVVLKAKEILGIVGGFGPVAHIGLEQEILEAARRLKGANTDQEFPPWILSSMTETPNRLQYIYGKGPDALSGVVHSFRVLEDSYDKDGNLIKGADFAIMACITAHKLLEDVRKQVNMEIVSLVEETAEYISKNITGAKVGILATNVTIQFNLFQDECAKRGVETFSPLDFSDNGKVQKELVMDAIFGSWQDQGVSHGGIKGEGVKPEYIDSLKEATRLMSREFGINAVIAGCTELDCALKIDKINDVQVIRPYKIISEYIIKRLYGL